MTWISQKSSACPAPRWNERTTMPIRMQRRLDSLHSQQPGHYHWYRHCQHLCGARWWPTPKESASGHLLKKTANAGSVRCAAAQRLQECLPSPRMAARRSVSSVLSPPAHVCHALSLAAAAYLSQNAHGLLVTSVAPTTPRAIVAAAVCWSQSAHGRWVTSQALLSRVDCWADAKCRRALSRAFGSTCLTWRCWPDCFRSTSGLGTTKEVWVQPRQAPGCSADCGTLQAQENEHH
mmetsp:Transcript_10565/g.18248  ORF Transcript_10565/g.18248 Transcript_10565/m.18248 type:complete len:235 (+) Transcript_10565:35-739(+)